MSTQGVLPKQLLRELMTSGLLRGVDEQYLNPASIDLPLSSEAYRLQGIFLPLQGEKIRDLLDHVGAIRHSLDATIEVGVSYIIRVEGNWKLPSMIYGYANPKSSTGRLGFFCRVVADGVDMYDTLTHGWSGEMWILARADYFPVKLAPGLALAQMRFFDGKAFLDQLEMEMIVEKHGLLYDEKKRKLSQNEILWHTDSLFLTLKVAGAIGWECRGVGQILDLSKTNFHDPEDFFIPIQARDEELILRKDNLYILTTRERVVVPPDFSAELRAIDPRVGEFRSHAAGYIDPGWGWGKNGEACGRPITLEVIPHETMIMRDGRRVVRIRYERMRTRSEVVYDEAASHYIHQERAQLSKHFKDRYAV